jgi:hypothetical protein
MNSHARWKLLVALAAVLATSLALSWPADAAGSGTQSVARVKRFLFHVNKVSPKNGGGEPSIAISPKGVEYVSYPGRPGMSFYRSTDGGKTWTRGKFAQTDSGDTTVNTDASGAVYQSNLWGSPDPQDTLQIDLFKSFNQGRTWPVHGQSALEGSNSSGQPFLVDRQWFDAWIPPGKSTKDSMVCMSYHDFGPGTVWAECSTDGGKTFPAPVNVINDPQAIADSYCDTIPGGTRIVQSGPHAGRIYVAWLAADPANAATGCNYTQGTAFHDIWVAISDDRGQTWTDKRVFDAGPGHDGSEIFADIALDNKGNPYVAFTMNLTNDQDPTGEFDTWVMASYDGGNTWKGLGKIPSRASCCAGSHYFPAIAAGDPGHVAVAWLYTHVVTPALPTGKPDFTAQDDANWQIVVARSANFNTSSPTWHVRTASKIVHHGNICTLGIACPPEVTNRHLLDFIDVQIDPNGYAHVAFTAADAPPVTERGLPDGIYVANQATGPTFGRGAHS